MKRTAENNSENDPKELMVTRRYTRQSNFRPSRSRGRSTYLTRNLLILVGLHLRRSILRLALLNGQPGLCTQLERVFFPRRPVWKRPLISNRRAETISAILARRRRTPARRSPHSARRSPWPAGASRGAGRGPARTARGRSPRPGYLAGGRVPPVGSAAT